MLKISFICQKMGFKKKLSSMMTSSLRRQTSYDTHPEMVIIRSKFDVCTSSSFGEVKAHIRRYKHLQIFLSSGI